MSFATFSALFTSAKTDGTAADASMCEGMAEMQPFDGDAGAAFNDNTAHSDEDPAKTTADAAETGEQMVYGIAEERRRRGR